MKWKDCVSTHRVSAQGIRQSSKCGGGTGIFSGVYNAIQVCGAIHNILEGDWSDISKV